MHEKVRTGAIQVRKVRGDVNPADLFTKHLPSSIKIAQIVKLFGCDYREGRLTATRCYTRRFPLKARAANLRVDIFYLCGSRG